MLQNAYFLAKIGADTAENERKFAEFFPEIGNYPTDRWGRRRVRWRCRRGSRPARRRRPKGWQIYRLIIFGCWKLNNLNRWRVNQTFCTKMTWSGTKMDKSILTRKNRLRYSRERTLPNLANLARVGRFHSVSAVQQRKCMFAAKMHAFVAERFFSGARV